MSAEIVQSASRRFPLAVANRVFGKDNLKPIIEELNEDLVA